MQFNLLDPGSKISTVDSADISAPIFFHTPNNIYKQYMKLSIVTF